MHVQRTDKPVKWLTNGFTIINLVISTFRFEEKQGLFWDGPGNFDPLSDEQDDSLSCQSVPRCGILSRRPRAAIGPLAPTMRWLFNFESLAVLETCAVVNALTVLFRFFWAGMGCSILLFYFLF
ncbi:hypothetical protein AVEN_238221-1 [Araneus ventricosus]|uniref:Uncharacterized protein n=1 Tax=Araneus ventricosus TaxID=182803 RepID=A0A4Y2I688_ARAVE|nr:hypothetical protein AVEN_238221-1 [Araneus ventricosus]